MQEDEKVEQFYDDIIERAMADSGSKYKIITGDFNAKNRTRTKKEDFNGMGAFGAGRKIKEEIASLNLQRNAN